MSEQGRRLLERVGELSAAEKESATIETYERLLREAEALLDEGERDRQRGPRGFIQGVIVGSVACVILIAVWPSSQHRG